MSRTITVSDTLYDRLMEQAHSQGMDDLAAWIEATLLNDNPQKRQQTVENIKSFREEMKLKYGEMPDSVSLVREDRGR